MSPGLDPLAAYPEAWIPNDVVGGEQDGAGAGAGSLAVL